MRGSGSGLWVVVLAVGMALAATAQTHRKAVQVATRPPKVTLADIAGGKTYGMKTAPIEIDEYSDFECPACRQLYMTTLRPLIDEYVSSGKVYLVHHDFPLPMHQYSRQAAAYADAAAAIGRFERVEQVLFTRQPEWSATGKLEPVVASVLTPAEMKQVEELARTSEVFQSIQQDVAKGQQLGIRQTPTMYITRKGKTQPIVGVVSYPVLRRYLDALLQQ